MTKYMVIQVQCGSMTSPEDATVTDITEAEWQEMSDDEQRQLIVEGAWNIVDAWAVAREEPATPDGPN